MKDKIIGIGLAIVLATGIYLSVFGAGEGASQKWTSYMIQQAISNQNAVIDGKLSRLEMELQAATERATSILMETNSPEAKTNALTVIQEAAAPIALYYLDSCSMTF